MKTQKSQKKPLYKFCLAGCGTIALLIIAGVILLGLWLTSGSKEPTITAYHPFKSEKAKRRFLIAYDALAAEWPVASQSRTIETSYGQTFVCISGLEKAEPLVLLHGVGGNSLQWLPNVEALSQYYRVYAVDNIYDYGRSVYTRPIKSADDYTQWLDELFNALELGERINVMGLSYGGWLTCQYALKHPNRLNKIVLIAPGGTVLPLSGEWIVRAALCVLPHRFFTKMFMSWLLEDLAQKDEESRKLVDKFADESYLALRSFKAKPMVAPTVLTDTDLQNIAIPALFLVGEHEKIYSAYEAVERLNAVAPQIKTEIIANAGHDITVVQSDIVNQKVLEFLMDENYQEK